MTAHLMSTVLLAGNMKQPTQDTERVKSGLRDAITLLCKTGLNFEDELNISGLLGITLDHDEVFLVDIKEVIKSTNFKYQTSKDERRRRKSSTVTRLRVSDLKSNESDDSENEYQCSSAKLQKLEDTPNSLQTNQDVDQINSDSQSEYVKDDESKSSEISRESVLTQNGPSDQGPQRYVRNTDVWFPDSSEEKINNETLVIVQPTADFEDHHSQTSSKCSQQSESDISDRLVIASENNTQSKETPSLPIQNNDVNVLRKNALSNPVDINSYKEENNGMVRESDDDEPINLCSRSASRNEQNTEAPLTIKQEVEEPAVTPLMFGSLPSGMLPEPEMHARWLQNIAAHVTNVVQPHSANSPPIVHNNKDRGSPLLSGDVTSPQLAAPQLPYVLNTPKLPSLTPKSSNSQKPVRSPATAAAAAASSIASSGNTCSNCGNDRTTTWRRMPSGQLVCNPCGLYYRLYKVGKQKQAGSGPVSSLPASQRCSNCSTGVTTMWRRNADGEPVCNACGLYYKLHKVNRPLSMVKSEIHSRRRKPRNFSPGGSREGYICENDENSSSNSMAAAASVVAAAVVSSMSPSMTLHQQPPT